MLRIFEIMPNQGMNCKVWYINMINLYSLDKGLWSAPTLGDEGRGAENKVCQDDNLFMSHVSESYQNSVHFKIL